MEVGSFRTGFIGEYKPLFFHEIQGISTPLIDRIVRIQIIIIMLAEAEPNKVETSCFPPWKPGLAVAY